MKDCVKWAFSVLAMIIVCKLAYNSGKQDGERGLGYWQGWHDAMMQTSFGTKPFNSETNLK